MFEKRLTWFWILLTAMAVVIVGRLVQIQVVSAAEYEELAERLLTRPARYPRAPRGTVYDRHGSPLLSDEPSSDICIHYGLLTKRKDYLFLAARQLRKSGVYPPDMSLGDIVLKLEQSEIPRMWQRLSSLTGRSEQEFRERAAEIQARVERVRAAVQRRSPNVGMIAEENQLLPLLDNVDNEVALAVRLELDNLPWLRVTPASRRVAHDADTLVHLLGRMGAASAERIAHDEFRDDELRRLRPGETCGISGIERMAETSLRGQRGRVREDFDGRVTERIEPIPGHAVDLTIDRDLQEYVFSRLEQTVQKLVHPAGAAAVVIDARTREVRALVNYPIYSYAHFNEQYEELRRDAKRLPMMSRAVQAQYPPGSTCKAITLVAGLSEGVVTAGTRIHCTGYLLPEHPDRFRCWIYNLNPGITHDMTDNPEGQDAVSAIRNSCNIYFYKVGGMLGPERLCEWFSHFGFGRVQGTGLIEESRAIVPTEKWLLGHAGRRHRASDAWNFAIGQGEVTATPLQGANVAATIATGSWAPVRLAYDDTGHAFGPPPAPTEPLPEESLRVLRRGMWEVVNARGGTGRYAHLDCDDVVLCGKTGSAQAQPRPIAYRYTFEWPDGHRENAVAYLEQDAAEQFGDDRPKRVGKHTVARYPALNEGERLPSHAWFIGYTQPADTPPGARPADAIYAISVLVEYGGSGGRVAGPVAKEIAEYLVESVQP